MCAALRCEQHRISTSPGSMVRSACSHWHAASEPFRSMMRRRPIPGRTARYIKTSSKPRHDRHRPFARDPARPGRALHRSRDRRHRAADPYRDDVCARRALRADRLRVQPIRQSDRRAGRGRAGKARRRRGRARVRLGARRYRDVLRYGAHRRAGRRPAGHVPRHRGLAAPPRRSPWNRRRVLRYECAGWAGGRGACRRDLGRLDRAFGQIRPGT